jgi:hypothetical protein
MDSGKEIARSLSSSNLRSWGLDERDHSYEMVDYRNSRTTEFLSAIRALMDDPGPKSMIQSI